MDLGRGVGYGRVLMEWLVFDWSRKECWQERKELVFGDPKDGGCRDVGRKQWEPASIGYDLKDYCVDLD